jgi:hypothetical protein
VDYSLIHSTPFSRTFEVPFILTSDGHTEGLLSRIRFIGTTRRQRRKSNCCGRSAIAHDSLLLRIGTLQAP